MVQQSLVAFFLVMSVLLRLVPHPWNFTPVVGIGLFCGAVMPKRWGLVLPVLAMAAGDLMLGWVPVHLFGWGAVALSGCIGLALRKRRSPLRIVLATFAGSTLFFLISNFGVWLLGCRAGWYPPTWSGLIACIAAGIPFYRNGLVGDFVYSGILFGSTAFFHFWQIRRQKEVPTVAASR